MKKSNLLNINVWITRETEKAYLVKNALDKEAWLPKGQLKDKEPIEGKPGKFSFKAPVWLLVDKGLI